jgi:hypothetical protein
MSSKNRSSLIAFVLCSRKKSLTVVLLVNIIDQLCSDLCQPIVAIWRRMFTVRNIIITE